MQRVRLKMEGQRRKALAFSVLVTGGRYQNTYSDIAYRLDDVLSAFPIRVLFEGGAIGTDSFARRWAQLNGVPYISFNADWGNAGHRGAGLVRNRRMVDTEPDLCLAFPGGTGTDDMVRQCKACGIPVLMVTSNKATITNAKEVVLGG